MPNGVYNRGLYLFATGGIVPGTSDLRMLLVQDSYVFDPTHNVVSDVVGGSPTDEIQVSGYARQTLTVAAATEDDDNDRAYIDADDPTFASLAAGQTIGGAVVYLFDSDDDDSEVLFFLELPDTPTNGTDFRVQFAAPGSGGMAYLYHP